MSPRSRFPRPPRWAAVLYEWLNFGGPRAVAVDITDDGTIRAAPGDVVIYGDSYATPIHEASFAVVNERRELIQIQYTDAMLLAQERGIWR